MKNIFRIFLAVFCVISAQNPLSAKLIVSNPSNYTSFFGTLVAGDTLFLSAGTYLNNLTLNNLNGISGSPIVITGDSVSHGTLFNATSCCNTVSITKCSYLVIRHLKLDGLNLDVDAVKAEGTTGNWAHHITLEYLTIVNYGNNQQDVGISTKCSAWNWIIRKNTIIGAGTGMYLGNSDGTKPFVNGLIEQNLIKNTVGYNIEIKHQLDSVRFDFAGTQVNGKTIIRYNVFSKDSNASTGANARPNVLLGAFPSQGWGTDDYYEVYGNFFYQNPVEALFQGTANLVMHHNIFINHAGLDGFRAVYITVQNGFQPRSVKIYQNTVWSNYSSGSIRLYNPNTNFKQYCYGNAVFSPNPISGFPDILDNITDSYESISNYVLSATKDLSTMNLYPQSGKLTGLSTPNTLFQNHTDWNIDFNGDVADWTFRGAYSGCCTNNGWHLKVDTMPSFADKITGIAGETFAVNVQIFPNPADDFVTVQTPNRATASIVLCNFLGQKHGEWSGENERIDLREFPRGMYILHVKIGTKATIFKLVKRE